MIDRDPREHFRESRAREIVREIESRKRPDNHLDRAIAREKERYGRIRPSRYELNNDQRRLYEDLKVWRVMRPKDIQTFRYGGSEAKYHRDYGPMHKYGLVEHSRMKGRSIMVHRTDTKYSFYDAAHDAEVYALYERNKREIELAHGAISSVKTEAQLQSEFWKRVGSKANQKDPRVREKIAREMDLPIINGKVMFPDVRIEYDIQIDGKWEHRTRDLEQTTGAYTETDIAEKHAAGFSVSGPNSHLGGVPKNVYQSFGR